MAEEYESQRIYVAVKGIVIRDGRALIVRRSGILTPDGRDWWEFPGGTLQFRESPAQTLVREFYEETGLRVVPKKVLYVCSVQNDPAYQVIIITYLCDGEDMSEVRLSDEHTGYMWADSRQMRELLADDIKNAMDANGVWAIFDNDSL